MYIASYKKIIMVEDIVHEIMHVLYKLSRRQSVDKSEGKANIPIAS